MKSKLPLISASILLFSTALSSQAAWETKFFDPKELPDTVILPMPCEGAMAFRVVKTGTQKPLDDKAVVLGSDKQEDAYAEHATPNYIAGSFGDEDGKAERYFLMGKYEVTQLQYDAVMKDTCPTPSMKLRMPVTEVSWFDAVQFSHKYTQWLLQNAPDKLPKEGETATTKRSGFIRLPTNAEWEFAARGGVAVSESQFRESRFPMPDGGISNYAWFASSSSANGKLNLAGQKSPNPLGLYDVLGNASEMVFDSFKMNKLDRYHGQAGGLTIRGASYLQSEGQLSSAYRVENSYYKEDGKPYSAKDVGFRVAVVAPVITAQDRSKKLDQAWQSLGKGDDKDQAIANTFQNLTSQVQDDELKKQIKTLEDQVRASNQAKEEQRDYAIRSTLELGAFLCADIFELNQVNEKNKLKISGFCAEDDLKENADRKDSCEKFAQQQESSQKALDFVVRYYADTIVGTASSYNEKDMLNQKDPTITKLGNQGNTKIGKYIDAFWSNLMEHYKTGKVERTKWLEKCSQ
ncbi:formylglycine-generating enzyme family protein [Lonepinella sp. BR2474]|uniref:formylglycine-generating enzyme family protein n=1 Tax=Lonepinella sp. BR2474 TaxID=3434548 RepID=UPI003F6DE4BF